MSYHATPVRSFAFLLAVCVVFERTGSAVECMHGCRSATTVSAGHIHADGFVLLMLLQILHILSFMAPDVHQCVSLGPGGYPDIKPAVLNSDPDTWPLPAAAPMELEGQQQNQNQNQQQNH